MEGKYLARNLVAGHRLDHFVPHGGVPSSGETNAIGEPRRSTRRLDTWQNKIDVPRELGVYWAATASR